MTDAPPPAYRILRPTPLLIGCRDGDVIEPDDILIEIESSRQTAARNAGRDMGTIGALIVIGGTLILGVHSVDQEWVHAYQAGMMLFILFGLVLLLRTVLVRRQCRRDATSLLAGLVAGGAVAPEQTPIPGPTDLCFLVRDAPNFPGQALREGRMLTRSAFHQMLVRGCRHAGHDAMEARRHLISGGTFGVLAMGWGIYGYLAGETGGQLAYATINLALGILVLLIATSQFRIARTVHRMLIDYVDRDSRGDDVIDHALDAGILERRWLRSPPTPLPASTAP